MGNKENLQASLIELRSTILNFIVPLICLVSSAVLFFVVIFPAMKKLPTLTEELSSTVEIKSKLEKKVRDLDKLKSYKRVFEEDYSLVSHALGSSPEAPQLLNQIDTLAKEAGLSVERLTYALGDVPTTSTDAAGVSGAQLQYVVVNMSALGTVDQVRAFLKNVESAARVLEIMNFRYSVDVEKGASTIEMSFGIKSPYLQIADTKTAGDTPIDLDISNPDFVKLINRIKGMRYFQYGSESSMEATSTEE